MNFKEIKLYNPVRDWLSMQGYDVYGEVPFLGRMIDVVGKNGDEIICVELKITASRKVFYQAYINLVATHKSYIAVASNPLKRSIDFGRRYGIGILTVVGDVASCILEPNAEKETNGYYKNMLRINDCQKDVVAGFPQLKGCGPAQTVRERIGEYLKENPGASWKDLYDNIPNHYANKNSMAGGMRSIEIRKEIKERDERYKRIMSEDSGCPG